MKPVDFSIVIPVYCNQGSLTATYKILHNDVILKNKSRTYEIIFVDDGSEDGSYEELKAVREKDPEHVKLVKLTRNFGQAAAVAAGYQYANGRCVVNISADLQDPPALINEMLSYHFESGYDIVLCHREEREESLFRRVTSKIFYKIISKLCFKNMPIGGFDFALISKRVKEIMLNTQEANPFWQGQILWTGYQVKFIPYKRAKRGIGESKWTTSKKIKYLIDGIMAYSYFPLRLMSVTGIIVSFAGFCYAISIFVSRVFGAIPIQGWAPLMIVILLLSGFQMLMLGVIGEYLWRALDQVRSRPQYLVETVENGRDD